MAGSGFENDLLYAGNADFSGAAAPALANGLNANGQLWIGRTTPNANGTLIDVNTLTAGTGISILNGAGSITIANTGSINDLHTARYIVSAGGAIDGANYTTIATAYAAAVAAGGVQTVFIQPGTYTENITLSPNVNLSAYACDSFTPNVTIIGKFTANFSGSATISNIRLQTNSDFFLQMSGSNPTVINLSGCFLNCANSVGISNSVSNSSSLLNINSCTGSVGSNVSYSYFTDTSTGSLIIVNSYLPILGSVGTSTKNNGTITFANSSFFVPVSFVNTNVSVANVSNCYFNTVNVAITNLIVGATICNVSNCYFNSGSAVPINIPSGGSLVIDNCTLITSGTTSISGTGSVQYSNISQSNATNNANIQSTLTQTAKISSNDAITVISPGSYPYTVLPQDAFILVDSSVARSITITSNRRGQKHTIKDNGGLAATNNITITPSSGNIDGAASYVINTNYGSIDCVYTGTAWAIK